MVLPIWCKLTPLVEEDLKLESGATGTTITSRACLCAYAVTKTSH